MRITDKLNAICNVMEYHGSDFCDTFTTIKQCEAFYDMLQGYDVDTLADVLDCIAAGESPAGLVEFVHTQNLRALWHFDYDSHPASNIVIKALNELK